MILLLPSVKDRGDLGDNSLSGNQFGNYPNGESNHGKSAIQAFSFSIPGDRGAEVVVRGLHSVCVNRVDCPLGYYIVAQGTRSVNLC